jgi:hypothetical protein
MAGRVQRGHRRLGLDGREHGGTLLRPGLQSMNASTIN